MLKQDEILRMAIECQLMTTANRDGVYAQALESFAKLVAKAKAEELATELEKGPLNDTATSIAIWIRSQE